MITQSRVELLDNSIKLGLQYLKKEQLSDGEFMTVASSDSLMETGCFNDSSCFITSFILYSLRFLDSSPVIEEITRRALSFLLSQMDEGGIFRYWSKKNSRRDSFPPDLDDTACISAALSLYGIDFPDNRVFFAENRNKEGLFYTWLLVRNGEHEMVSSRVLQKINSPAVLFNILRVGKVFNYEPAVNANVLFYLGENELTRHSAAYLVEIIKKRREEKEATYYPGKMSLYYFLARAYARGAPSLEKIRSTLVKRIISCSMAGPKQEPVLSCALALCALSHLNYISSTQCNEERLFFERQIDFLLEKQEINGGWKKEAFFLGPAPYYGAGPLTTGFCLEALGLYRRSLLENQPV